MRDIRLAVRMRAVRLWRGVRSARARSREKARRTGQLAGLIVLCGAVVLLAGFDASAQRVPPVRLAPVLNERSPTAIAGAYIVVFRPNVRSRAGRGLADDRVAIAQSVAAQAVVRRLGGTVGFTYRAAIIGFSARLPPAALAAVRTMPGVDWIESDQRAELATVQVAPPLGLDRTSERIGMDGKYTYNLDGTGVHAYVIDTGILSTHAEFGNRVGQGYAVVGSTPDDCHGHGTHVAGTIGALTWGIAKNVSLHSIRVLDCSAWGTSSDVIQGIDWLIWNAQRPAVANVSLRFWQDPALDTAVDNAVSSGITFVVAAANDGGDACQVSPARVVSAITVGSIDPLTDMRVPNSNFGTCLDIFAPGGGIESASLNGLIGPPGSISSGTSMAAPHVVGVAALYLQTTIGNSVAATPADVWDAIDDAATITGTGLPYNWPGIPNRGAGSPDKLLHWGAGSNDGYMDGDPHLQTVDGIHYDLQGAGEFVYLREAGGLEVQIRHTPLPTTTRGSADPYDGLSTCVSLNTAVAARVGSHRVTFQQGLNGPPTSDPNSLEMRVDGVVTPLTPQGLNLGSGLVRRSGANGMEIHFADGTVLLATPGWFSSHNMWWVSVDVLHTTATQGLLGRIAPGSWLPRLSNGASVGPMPSSLAQRYAVLYQQFAESWRISNATTLFDYRPGTSTATFTDRNWPTLTGACTVRRIPTAPSRPAPRRLAEQVCLPVRDPHRRAACTFDVQVTGETGFARTYLLSQEIRSRLTNIFPADPTRPRERR